VAFEQKKVKVETLSEYLSNVRQSFNFSINDLVKKTGIPANALGLLEQGNYSKLPAKVYVKGFLQKLARVYGLDAQVLIDQYELEQVVNYKITQASGSQTKKKFFNWEQITLTPKIITILVSVIFVSFTILYIIWQVFAIAQTPFLEITSPQNLTATDKTFIVVEGRTDPSATVSVNNEPVFVNDEGKFLTNVGLSAGPKELVITATNRFRRSITKQLTVIGQVKHSETVMENTRTVLMLEFKGKVEVSSSVDGQTRITKNYLAGQQEIFENFNNLDLSVSNAGLVTANLNGKNIGILGRDGEKIENLIFTK
jgi:cytoskeletal protein RodZ